MSDDEFVQLGIDTSDGNFFYDCKNGTYLTQLNHAPIVAAPTCTIWNEPQEKPFYLAILMSKQQLQTIIDHRELFDASFINAAYLLMRQYDEISVSD